MKPMEDFLATYRFVATGDHAGHWVAEVGHPVMFLVSYDGPNLMRQEACSALILMPDCMLNQPLSASEIDRVQRLVQQVCQPAEPPVRNPYHLADWLLCLLLQLQRRRFFPVNWGHVSHRSDGATEIAFEMGRSAWAARLVGHALALLPDGASVRHLLDELDKSLVPRLSYLYRHDRHKTAARLGVYRPTVAPLDVGWSYLGQGRQACLIAGGSTSHTSAMAKELTADKSLTLARLRLNGMPVSEQRVVATGRDAVAAASQLGYPVVVKPLRGHQSKGVTVNLGDDAAVRAAFDRAQERHPHVVVEPYQYGRDYRLLVIGGKFVAAVRRDVRTVDGDGHSSVRQLVEQANETVRGTGLFFSPIKLDDDALATLAVQGHNPDSIPVAGERLRIREMASPESTATDVTDDVHPDNRSMAVDAAEACLLDVAGIDFVSADIAVSWRTNGGRIIEVNAGPAADLHLFPQHGSARDLSRHLIRSCLPANRPGRIPVVMCLGESLPQHWLNHTIERLSRAGWRTGCPAAGAAVAGTDPSVAIAGLLTNPALDAAAFFWPFTRVPALGFPVDRVRITVIADLPQALTQGQLNCWGKDVMLRICRIACDLATDSVVIDGTNPVLRDAVAHRPAHQVGYLWPEDSTIDDTPLRMHEIAGGWAITSPDAPEASCANSELNGDDAADSWVASAAANAVLRAMPPRTNAQAPDSRATRRLTRSTTKRWSPDELAQTFCGAWVNGPDRGWDATRLVTEPSALEPGDVLVCRSTPDDLAGITENDAKILRAFSLGAKAVIATQVPTNLPRWQPVLVCDDIDAGLVQMGLI